ncbi:histone promoter control 2 [Suhomyces tanzawaensis NRRL Y-17324]|uniref:Histone promoter control 2 n=1 Tax=Suhomyces tanzawaensis NRRL Y-17324 TaxID=984487 RepID=A0A1E4SFQ9_9ASCO|nr:histone promoter control 2 [Suhomyces tanzawaensis NRRL Y-17324]ODV78300.1 histone promoter control 2 [Suhomyces tanzawaensis NRRL Y-17324]
MSKRNVPISSLLGSNSDDAPQVVRSATSSPKQPVPNESSLLNFVSKFRTSVEMSPTPGQGPTDPQKPYVVLDDDDIQVVGKGTAKKQASRKPIAIRPSPLPVLIPKPQTTATASPAPPASRDSSHPPVIASDTIKKFQTSFQLPAQPFNKSSINSIINIDDEPEVVHVNDTPNSTPAPVPVLTIPSTNPSLTTTTTTTAAPPKKKRAAPKKKTDEASKKRKTDDATNNDEKKTTKTKSTDGKTAEPKKATKGKKKTPETTTVTKSEYEKLPIHPGMTTDKSKTTIQPPQLPRPTVIDLLNPMKEDEPTVVEEKPKEEPKEKKEEKVDPPIIALNIPLIDSKNPKPGQSELVINVLRLSEEKYGWSVIHPKAKSAIDIMDDMIDDEDDAMDEDEDEELIADEEKVQTAIPTKKKKDEELTEEQLVRQHEVKMNRKVGKYDYEDPFIDDEELQMEEEITSTKEGFFVYWGPLVDDRNMTGSGSKKTSKAKK